MMLSMCSRGLCTYSDTLSTAFYLPVYALDFKIYKEEIMSYSQHPPQCRHMLKSIDQIIRNMDFIKDIIKLMNK